MLVSQTMPGLFWPIGKPLTGVVTDADTGLPLGKATVISGFGTAMTDPNGRFSLYGALSADSISASRAGYTSVTYKGGGHDGVQFALYPLFPNKGDLPARYANIVGLSPLRNAGIMFSDRTAAAIGSDSRFLLDLKGGLPGSVYSGVLASGNINGGPITDARSSFYFDSFGFNFIDVLFQDSPALAEATPTQINPAAPSATMENFTLQFSSLGELTNVLTTVALDFGMRGDILVARQYSSNQQIKVPTKVGLVYALEGTAYSADNSLSSKVTVSTNTLGKSISFDLLPPPKPLSPGAGQKVGSAPEFKWRAVSGADGYVVKVFENGDPRPKWMGYTSSNSINYPTFPDGDLNGGALLAGADVKYTWSVVAVADGVGGTSPNAPPTRPFLQKHRESAASNDSSGSMGFQK
jgi:hypothetical protein